MFGIEGDQMDAILKVLQLNPFFPPEYMRLGFDLLDRERGRIWLEDCELLNEQQARGATSLLAHHPENPGFDALVAAVNPRAKVRTIDPKQVVGAVVAWELYIDPDAEQAKPSDLAGLVATADMLDLDNTAYPYDYQ